MLFNPIKIFQKLIELTSFKHTHLQNVAKKIISVKKLI